MTSGRIFHVKGTVFGYLSFGSKSFIVIDISTARIRYFVSSCLIRLSYERSWLCSTTLFDEVQGLMGPFTRCIRLLSFSSPLRLLLFYTSMRGAELIRTQCRIGQMNNAAGCSEKSAWLEDPERPSTLCTSHAQYCITTWS